MNKVINKENLNGIGLLLLRISIGLAMLLGHGLGKWSNLIEGGEIQFADPFGFGPMTSMIMAVFAEVFCSSLLIFGLLTRWALIPLLITMAVATFYVHFADGFGGMEKAFLYFVGFVALFFTGPGKFSIDALIKSNK
ncbi:DoxX family protein [Brumimicrobium aurantiacum]|uniref:DoxX family protein n=1 Tax=Brumimicrobium aurantiacum TaxID=1737063 RepID=A0A3E1F2E2_9FLAO|nr:DoxX family protein [Brumimicrobium aurantiacum]RFC55984.1 DoxX family protein [Brumimicrobium aurantiacum]